YYVLQEKSIFVPFEAILNAIRQCLLQKLETIAIQRVAIHRNNTSVPNDVLRATVMDKVRVFVPPSAVDWTRSDCALSKSNSVLYTLDVECSESGLLSKPSYHTVLEDKRRKMRSALSYFRDKAMSTPLSPSLLTTSTNTNHTSLPSSE